MVRGERFGALSIFTFLDGEPRGYVHGGSQSDGCSPSEAWDADADDVYVVIMTIVTIISKYQQSQ